MRSELRFLSVLLLLVTMFTLAGAAVSGGAAPRIETFTKSSQAGAEIRFSQEDFVSRVTPGAKLEGIVLTSIPDPLTGGLYFAGRNLLAGEAVTAEALASLSFRPATNTAVTTSFDFLPVFSTGVGKENVTVAINMSGKENRPPVAEDMALTTYKNMPVKGVFKAMDPDNDPLTFKFTSKPRRGEVELLEDGSFQYTPYQNKTGKDSVQYVAVDSFGNESQEAEIAIKIEKPGTKVTYADLEGHTAHYPALKLVEAEVFIGEKIGNQYYFDPEKPITRAEFITLTVTALGLDADVPVSRTGFSDDADIPVWAKPYATAALKAGIVSGYSDADGRRLFGAENLITRAEAAVILNNAIRLADTESKAVFTDAVPAWAYQAAVNLEAANVISPYGDGSLRADTQVCRADAADMLYKAMEHYENTHKKRGLLSWAFG